MDAGGDLYAGEALDPRRVRGRPEDRSLAVSRTDAHTPLWVIEDGPWWYLDFYEAHDHRFGPCDIDGPAEKHDRACRRWFNGRRRICSCWMCGLQPQRRLKRRQERAQWRVTRQRILAEVDRTDVDVPSIHGTTWW